MNVAKPVETVDFIDLRGNCTDHIELYVRDDGAEIVFDDSRRTRINFDNPGCAHAAMATFRQTASEQVRECKLFSNLLICGQAADACLGTDHFQSVTNGWTPQGKTEIEHALMGVSNFDTHSLDDIASQVGCSHYCLRGFTDLWASAEQEIVSMQSLIENRVTDEFSAQYDDLKEWLSDLGERNSYDGIMAKGLLSDLPDKAASFEAWNTFSEKAGAMEVGGIRHAVGELERLADVRDRDTQRVCASLAQKIEGWDDQIQGKVEGGEVTVRALKSCGYEDEARLYEITVPALAETVRSDFRSRFRNLAGVQLPSSAIASPNDMILKASLAERVLSAAKTDPETLASNSSQSSELPKQRMR